MMIHPCTNLSKSSDTPDFPPKLATSGTQKNLQPPTSTIPRAFTFVDVQRQTEPVRLVWIGTTIAVLRGRAHGGTVSDCFQAAQSFRNSHTHPRIRKIYIRTGFECGSCRITVRLRHRLHLRCHRIPARQIRAQYSHGGPRRFLHHARCRHRSGHRRIPFRPIRQETYPYYRRRVLPRCGCMECADDRSHRRLSWRAWPAATASA